jgi:hypothetical protein
MMMTTMMVKMMSTWRLLLQGLAYHLVMTAHTWLGMTVAAGDAAYHNHQGHRMPPPQLPHAVEQEVQQP